MAEGSGEGKVLQLGNRIQDWRISLQNDAVGKEIYGPLVALV